MEALVSLKRPSPVTYDLCIICQEKGIEDAHKPTVAGLERIQLTTEKRKKLRDVANCDSIDRIKEVFAKHIVTELVDVIKWHRKRSQTGTNLNALREYAISKTMNQHHQPQGVK